MKTGETMCPESQAYNTPELPYSHSRLMLRNLLSESLKTDSELEAFLIDHFPDVQRSLSNTQDRTGKINALLMHVEENSIYKDLTEKFPELINDPKIEQTGENRTPPQTR